MLKDKKLSKQTGSTKISQIKQEKIRELFICYCRKEYQSFPALYLHIRQKHNLSIKKSQISTMRNSMIWSGAKRKMIYEADQNQLLQELQQDQIVQQSIQQQVFQPQENSPQLHQSYIQLPDTLLRFFSGSNFPEQMAQNQQNKIRDQKRMISFLYKFYSRKMLQERSNSPQNQNLESLPLFFNEFMLYQLPKINNSLQKFNETKNLLLSLSKWLYDTSQTPHIAVE